MPARSFFDTNVLIYADDKDAPAKGRLALELLAEHRRNRTGVVSLQVLQEYFVTATRKLNVEPSIARRKVQLLAEFDVAAPDLSDILAAIDLHRLHNLSFWDALVIRSAKQSGCSVVLSEGMQHLRRDRWPANSESVQVALFTGERGGKPRNAACALQRIKRSEDYSIAKLQNHSILPYFITPRCAIPILSRVVFLTRYIISSAWRIISCASRASCG